MKQPTKKQILDASKECPDAKAVLKKLYPEVLNNEDGWEEIPAEDLEFNSESNNGGIYFTLWDKVDNDEIGCMDCYAKYEGKYKSNINLRFCLPYTSKYKIVPQDIENGNANFRVYRKVGE